MTTQTSSAPELLTGVEAARAVVTASAGRGFGALGDDELAAALVELTGLVRQAESMRVELLAEAERRSVAEREAATSTDAWAAALTGERRQLLRGGLVLAELLTTTYAATREAFAAGRLGFDQAMVIVRAAEQSPPAATPEQVRAAEELLVAKATGVGNRSGRPMDARTLRHAARRMFVTIDAELADRHEAIMLGREERRAENETWLTLGDNGDGTFTGKFCIPELHGQLLRTALQRLSAPRRLSRTPGGESVVDESAPTAGLYELHGVAFCELVEHLPTVGWSANGVTMLVTIDLERLRDGLGAARLDTGARISAGEARRLACTAGLVPAVLGGASTPLDLGRSARLFSPGQRRALALIHDTCGIDTCQRPFAWCEAHHRKLWSRGGTSNLGDAVPLCGHHHRRAHDGRFDLRRHPGGGWRLHPRR